MDKLNPKSVSPSINTFRLETDLHHRVDANGDGKAGFMK
jgi:hypothetical protein